MADRQFKMVNSTYGAPMGRHCYGTPDTCEGKIRLFRVRLNNGGYDDGGAYWGLPTYNLFCAQAAKGEGYQQFERAPNRLMAAAQFEIPASRLLVPVTVPLSYRVEKTAEGTFNLYLASTGKLLASEPTHDEMMFALYDILTS